MQQNLSPKLMNCDLKYDVLFLRKPMSRYEQDCLWCVCVYVCVYDREIENEWGRAYLFERECET